MFLRRNFKNDTIVSIGDSEGVKRNERTGMFLGGGQAEGLIEYYYELHRYDKTQKIRIAAKIA